MIFRYLAKQHGINSGKASPPRPRCPKTRNGEQSLAAVKAALAREGMDLGVVALDDRTWGRTAARLVIHTMTTSWSL